MWWRAPTTPNLSPKTELLWIKKMNKRAVRRHHPRLVLVRIALLAVARCTKKRGAASQFGDATCMTAGGVSRENDRHLAREAQEMPPEETEEL